MQLRDIGNLAGIFPLDVSRDNLDTAQKRRRERDLAIHGNRRCRHWLGQVGDSQRRIDVAADIASDVLSLEDDPGIELVEAALGVDR